MLAVIKIYAQRLEHSLRTRLARRHVYIADTDSTDRVGGLAVYAVPRFVTQ